MADQGAWRNRKVMRLMAWERAKGELHAMLYTFWDEPGDPDDHELVSFRNKVDTFIKAVDKGYTLTIEE